MSRIQGGSKLEQREFRWSEIKELPGKKPSGETKWLQKKLGISRVIKFRNGLKLPDRDFSASTTGA